MTNHHLANYLNVHLAGATAALEMLDQLQKGYAGQPRGYFLADLRADIDADRKELEVLMRRLGIAASTPRRAAAWLAEKVSELKLWLDDRAGGNFRLFEAAEAIAVGIQGKRAMWRALAAAAADNGDLQGLDYPRLIDRAEDQWQRVEQMRLESARTVLGSVAP